MANILLIIFVSLVVLLGINVFSIRYINFLFTKLVRRKHEWIESIISTSQIPESWTKKYRKKTTEILQKQRNKGNMKILSKKAYRKYLQRLDQLISYIKITTVVENEEVRKEILIRLQEVRKEWEEESRQIVTV
ncbi:hypothetical protein ES708_07185 [subsurface metagenome]